MLEVFPGFAMKLAGSNTISLLNKSVKNIQKQLSFFISKLCLVYTVLISTQLYCAENSYKRLM